MKVRIKTFNGELPEYLTEGKVYKCWKSKEVDIFYFRNDIGNAVFGILNKPDNVDGILWEVVE